MSDSYIQFMGRNINSLLIFKLDGRFERNISFVFANNNIVPIETYSFYQVKRKKNDLENN